MQQKKSPFNDIELLTQMDKSSIPKEKTIRALKSKTKSVRGDYFSKKSKQDILRRLKEKNQLPSNFKEYVLSCNEKIDLNKSHCQKLKEENTEFLSSYRKAASQAERTKKKNKEWTGPFEAFLDLIAMYKERGYAIPDLSVKNNLFEPSPLLMENKNIVNYYKSNLVNKNSRENFEDDLILISKFIELINGRIIGGKDKPCSPQRKISISGKSIYENFKFQTMNQIKLSKRELKSEIENLKSLIGDQQKNEIVVKERISSRIVSPTHKRLLSLKKITKKLSNKNSTTITTNFETLMMNTTNENNMTRKSEKKSSQVSSEQIKSKAATITSFKKFNFPIKPVTKLNLAASPMTRFSRGFKSHMSKLKLVDQDKPQETIVLTEEETKRRTLDQIYERINNKEFNNIEYRIKDYFMEYSKKDKRNFGTLK